MDALDLASDLLDLHLPLTLFYILYPLLLLCKNLLFFVLEKLLKHRPKVLLSWVVLIFLLV